MCGRTVFRFVGGCSGDSRLFLVGLDGKTNISVPCGKEGAIHDFCWSPKGDSFVVIAGKSPPMATLHNRAGLATFSFGTGAFNTVAYQPQGRFVLLGGFGNMSGALHLWDTNKLKPLAEPIVPDATTQVSWTACGRKVITATTFPRLKVDNGFSVWTHRGQRLSKATYGVLFGVYPRPAPEGSFPDRAASPPPADARAPAPVGTIAKAASYVPPHMRGLKSESVVSKMMTEDAKPSGKILAPAFVALSGAGVSIRYVALGCVCVNTLALGRATLLVP